MAVGVREQSTEKGIAYPRIGAGGKGDKGDQPWEDPEVTHTRDDGSFFELLRNPCENEQLDCKEELRRNQQHIGLKSAEPQLTQDVREVGVRGRRRDVRHKTDEVQRPLFPIGDRLPQKFWANTRSVVHVSFGWVVAQDAVDHDIFFVLGEPSVLAAEPRSSLSRSSRHKHV